MKVDFNNKAIRDYNGEEAKLPNGDKQMIKDLVCKCLYIGNEKLTPDEKYQAYTLCVKIRESIAEIELKAEDISLIKRICGECISGAGGYGQIVDLLEGGR